VLDPEISTPDESIAFLREFGAARPDLLWIINTHDRWWRRNRQRVIGDSRPELVRQLRCLNKGFTYARARERLAALLAQCEIDIASRLLTDAHASTVAALQTGMRL